MNILTYKNTKSILLFVLTALFAYASADAVIKISAERTIGSIFRNFLPTAPYLLLILLINVYEIRNVSFSSLCPNIPSNINFKLFLKRLILIFIFTVPVGLIITHYSLRINVMYTVLILFVFICFMYSLHSVISGKPFLAIMMFLIVLPFVSYLEYSLHYFLVFRGIEWGPFILTPTIIILNAIFFVALFHKPDKQENHKNKCPVFIAISIFIFIFFISSLHSDDPILSMRHMFVEWIVPLMLFFLFLKYINTEKELKRFLYIILFSYCLSSIISIYFFMKSADAFDIRNIHRADVLASGMVTGGVWGGISAMLLPLTFSLFFLSSRRGKIIFFAILVLFLITLVLSYSRISLISFLFATSIFLIDKRMRKYVLSISIGLAIVFVLNTTFLSEYVLYRFRHISSVKDFVNDGSLQARLEGAKGGLRMMKDYPIFGIGMGMWKDYVPHYCKRQMVVGEGGKYELGYIISAHNRYIQIAVDAGIFAIIAWLFILFIIIKQGLYVIRRKSNQFRYYLMLGAISSFICFIALSFGGGGSVEGAFLGYNIMFLAVFSIILKLKYFEQNRQEFESDISGVHY